MELFMLWNGAVGCEGLAHGFGVVDGGCGGAFHMDDACAGA